MCYEIGEQRETILRQVIWCNINPYNLHLAMEIIFCDYCGEAIEDTCDAVSILNDEDKHLLRLYYHIHCLPKDDVVKRAKLKMKQWNCCPIRIFRKKLI